MILNVNMITWESSEERINENFYTETFKRLVWAFSNKDNARKKYFNFKRLSSDDIFAFLDSIKNDDEGDIKKIMNDSDTDFVAEDESVISTTIRRNQ